MTESSVTFAIFKVSLNNVNKEISYVDVPLLCIILYSSYPNNGFKELVGNVE
jgi:hypothetical protein